MKEMFSPVESSMGDDASQGGARSLEAATDRDAMIRRLSAESIRLGEVAMDPACSQEDRENILAETGKKIASVALLLEDRMNDLYVDATNDAVPPERRITLLGAVLEDLDRIIAIRGIDFGTLRNQKEAVERKMAEARALLRLGNRRLQ